MNRTVRRLTVLTGLIATLALAGAGSAVAHPLGNFTVNHYTGLTIHPDRIEGHILAYRDLLAHPKETVAVRLDDEAMFPILPAGSVVAVDRFSTAPGGKISYERGSIKVSSAVADAINAGKSVPLRSPVYGRVDR